MELPILKTQKNLRPPYLLTCFELLIFLLLSLLVLITGVYSGIMVKVLIAGVIISLTDIFICLFFLTLVIYTLFK